MDSDCFSSIIYVEVTPLFRQLLVGCIHMLFLIRLTFSRHFKTNLFHW